MDTVTLIGRVLVSLAAVLGVMWVIARRVRGSAKTRATKLVEVLGRQQVSKGASVAVVRVGEQAFVLGVTDSQISVLGDTDLAAAQAVAAQNEAGRRGGSRRATGRTTPTRPVRVEKPVATAAERPAERPAAPGALAGSALSPATWKQTIESLRDLTTRTD